MSPPDFPAFSRAVRRDGRTEGSNNVASDRVCTPFDISQRAWWQLLTKIEAASRKTKPRKPLAPDATVMNRRPSRRQNDNRNYLWSAIRLQQLIIATWLLLICQSPAGCHFADQADFAVSGTPWYLLRALCSSVCSACSASAKETDSAGRDFAG